MNPEQLLQKYRHLDDLHLTRILGAWVVISEGRVIEVEKSRALRCCPLQSMLSGADIETYAAEKITELGQFTPRREVWRSSFGVPFGASEMLMTALRKGAIDCAITVCDGAGTVVTGVPEVAQGIGARMNGVFYTSPIPQVQQKLRSHGCILFDDARIDQVEGLRKAVEAGFTRIVVTVNGRFGQRFADLRQVEKEAGVAVTIAAVCTTGIDDRRADEIIATCDLAWTCASRPLREKCQSAQLQLTQAIPVFVYTAKGRELLAAYSDEAGAAILRGLDPAKQHFLAAGGSGAEILLGETRLRIREAQLPIRSRNEPQPLD